ncbi:MAG TPA: hypothetical protein VJC16_07685 [Candidatus Nanoarchaeia archaeon]|nr:hypothetical protein [Candidatus Nanoarchaeia archaeon]
MPTTIQVEKETADLLRSMKEQTNASSYDEVIHHMIRQKRKESMYGALGKKSMKRLLKGLRDEHDRL